MWLPVTALVLGFVALVWSADRFLSGAASAASHLGVSKMFIGLTVVAVGTSTPEILVSLAAAIGGNPLLAVGNAIGSNIANIGLVLGVTAIVVPLPFSQAVLRAELPWLLGATLLTLVLLFDLELSRVDGLVMVGALVLILIMLIRNQHASREVAEIISGELEELPQMTMPQALTWLVVGLVILLASADLLVWAASTIADRLGVDDIIIGLTIVAVGTSLPEFAATLGSAIKGHTDIAIGNVVGSNILNILAVLAVPGLVHPTSIQIVSLWRDCGMMLALTLALALFAYAVNSRPVITRFEGAVMLFAWIGYNVLLILQARGG